MGLTESAQEPRPVVRFQKSFQGLLALCRELHRSFGYQPFPCLIYTAAMAMPDPLTWVQLDLSPAHGYGWGWQPLASWLTRVTTSRANPDSDVLTRLPSLTSGFIPTDLSSGWAGWSWFQPPELLPSLCLGIVRWHPMPIRSTAAGHPAQTPLACADGAETGFAAPWKPLTTLSSRSSEVAAACD